MAEITKIKGVGPVLAKACIEQGYGTVEKVAEAKIVEFVAVPGVSEIRAKLLIEAAIELLNSATTANATVAAEARSEPDDEPAKKAGAKKKKSKKKDKSKGKSSKKKDEKSKKDSKKKNDKKKKKNKSKKKK